MEERKLYFGRIKSKEEIEEITEKAWDDEGLEWDIILKGDFERKYGWICGHNDPLYGKFITFFREKCEKRFIYVTQDNDYGWPIWAIDEISDTSFEKI